VTAPNAAMTLRFQIEHDERGIGESRRSAIVRSTVVIGVACLLACCCGCGVFYREKVTAGYRYSKEAIGFLGQPGTTREDVIASFGPPLIDSTDGVLAYEWEVTRKVLVPTVDFD